VFHNLNNTVFLEVTVCCLVDTHLFDRETNVFRTEKLSIQNAGNIL